MISRHCCLRFTTRLLVLCCALSCAAVASASEAGGGYTWQKFQADLPLWAFPTFILFLIAIRKLGWDSFVTSLNNREAEENRLIEEARQARREAEELLRDHRGKLEAVDETIQELIAEAHRDAEHTRQDIISTARREAETLRNRALHEIARVRDQSLNEVFVTLNERVIAATEVRLAARMTLDVQDRLVEEALAQFETTH